MTIGIPKEIMKYEGRVALTPDGAKKITEAGHRIIVQTQAGKESGYTDEDFAGAGALIENEAQRVYQTDMVVKVKEPQKEEYELLKKEGILFAFLHLPANPELVRVLKEKKIIGIAYEGIQLENGERPILKPMSEVAGKTAVFEGIHFLRKENGGKGILPENAKIVILGAAGVVGRAATQAALALGASVIALDLPGRLPISSCIETFNPRSGNAPSLATPNPRPYPKLAQEHSPRSFAPVYCSNKNYITEISTPENIKKAVQAADLVIGAVAIPGGRAEKLISKEMVAAMEPGSVIVDVAIDEGGCAETSKPTTHAQPVFVESGVIHYCVKNMPGVVPRTSTPNLIKVTLPHILEICAKGIEKAVLENPALKRGIHIYKGQITNQKLAETLGEKYFPLTP